MYHNLPSSLRPCSQAFVTDMRTSVENPIAGVQHAALACAPKTRGLGSVLAACPRAIGATGQQYYDTYISTTVLTLKKNIRANESDIARLLFQNNFQQPICVRNSFL